MARRLNLEWERLEREPDEEDRFFPEYKINDFEWVMLLFIGEEVESVYAGGVYRLVLTFPSGYPFKPPLITWTPPVYHPSVFQEGFYTGRMSNADNEDGALGYWGPCRNVRYIMDKMYYMLASEDFSNYIDQEIYEEIRENYDIFKAKVQEQIKGLEYTESPFPCDMKSLACLCQQYENSGLHIGMLAFQRVLPQMYNHYGIRQNIIGFVFGFLKTERYHLKLSHRARNKK
jgi:ubiquitin-protein ligase